MPEELTDAEIDHLLERFDQTDPKLQRRIIASFVVKASAAAELQAALNNAPDRMDIGDDSVFLLQYLLWRGECVEKGLIAPKPPPAPPGPKREAVKQEAPKKTGKKPVVLCKHCQRLPAKVDDEYGRCDQCLDMVPSRRGGWRQLGVYDG